MRGCPIGEARLEMPSAGSLQPASLLATAVMSGDGSNVDDRFLGRATVSTSPRRASPRFLEPHGIAKPISEAQHAAQDTKQNGNPLIFNDFPLESPCDSSKKDSAVAVKPRLIGRLQLEAPFHASMSPS